MKAVKALLISLLVIFISCINDDDFVARQISVPTPDPEEVGLVACADAIYGPYMDSAYVLPYPVGDSYQVNLNHCSSSFHSEGRPDQFAVDFAMTIGSKVTASRAGRVVFVEEAGVDGGFPNNKVIVKHDDNTFAQYMHLTNQGAAVQIADRVEKGDLIGFSGATGLAGYAHLHFVVTTGSFEYPYISIPYNFSNTEENPQGPRSGEIYLAAPY